MRRLLIVLLFVAVQARAATLQLTVDRGATRGPLAVHIGTRGGDHDEGPRWIGVRRLAADQSAITLDELPAGIVVIQLRGAGPLERAAAQIRAGDGETWMTIPIRGKTLRGTITDGGVPLKNAKVRFVRNDDLWDAEIATDDRGRFATTFWQEGEFQVELHGGGLQGLVSTEASLRGDAVEWSYAVPSRTVRGRVVDEAGAPIAGAKVSLSRSDERATRQLSGRSAADGSFSFRGVAAGAHTLRVAAEAFLVSESVALQIAERADEQRTVTLRRGVKRTITVIDASGGPARNSVVVCASGSTVRSNGITDALGRVSVPVPAGERSTIYVFAPRGPLAVQRATDAESIRIHLPPSAGTVEVATLTTAGRPVPHMWLLMRYDGEVIPPEVVRIARRAGLVLNTDDGGKLAIHNLPAGRYEFWPYVNDEQAAALLASSVDFAAPVTLDVTGGTHRATLRFAE